MGILNFLNPISAFSSLKKLVKDFSNYLFYRKQIKKMNDQKLFDVVGGRVDWLRRVYYVINLEPETLLATGDLIDLEKSRVYESISKIQGRFADYNLVEIVEVTSKRIKDAEFYAYVVLIKYNSSSKFKDLLKVSVFGTACYFATIYGIELFNNFDAVVAAITNALTAK